MKLYLRLNFEDNRHDLKLDSKDMKLDLRLVPKDMGLDSTCESNAIQICTHKIVI